MLFPSIFAMAAVLSTLATGIPVPGPQDLQEFTKRSLTTDPALISVTFPKIKQAAQKLGFFKQPPKGPAPPAPVVAHTKRTLPPDPALISVTFPKIKQAAQKLGFFKNQPKGPAPPAPVIAERPNKLQVLGLDAAAENWKALEFSFVGMVLLA
ncbi:hypothetical protein HYFRA_00002329 [Hymenoscyphus fraxineus]|uniref:Uncharacterized protein n=1 Tax=Hymenoscyphus fraxineus TaxID=746836 RepID=A0A9N9LC76_9HELO|nr:hypothetical protein HYFRA_00002329 [Hymenoscyphus fraxineus]